MKPFLVVDGDSLAHRAYHGLPKTIRRAGGRPSGAIVGFTNMLTRLYESEEPRAVLVGWDTLTVPTYRHEAFAPYQRMQKRLLLIASIAAAIAGVGVLLGPQIVRRAGAGRTRRPDQRL